MHPNSVSGRVVNTVMRSPLGVASGVAQLEVDLGTLAAADPVRLHRLDALGPAGKVVEVVQSSWAYSVILKYHCSSSRFSTTLLQRQHTPSPSTCSLASTVAQSGHQFTGELFRSTSPLSQNFRKIHWPQR